MMMIEVSIQTGQYISLLAAGLTGTGIGWYIIERLGLKRMPMIKYALTLTASGLIMSGLIMLFVEAV